MARTEALPVIRWLGEQCVPSFHSRTEAQLDNNNWFLRGVGSLYAILDKPCAQFGPAYSRGCKRSKQTPPTLRVPLTARRVPAPGVYINSTIACVSAASHSPHFLAFHTLLLFLNPNPDPFINHTMTKETTPPPKETTTATHEPPSLPASPLAKRPKPSNTASNPTESEPTSKMGSNNAATPIPSLQVKKLIDTARAPTRGSAFAAGYDIYSAKETVIPSKGKALVDTGIAIAVPEGTCMLPHPTQWRNPTPLREENKEANRNYEIQTAVSLPEADSHRSTSLIPAPA